MLKSCCHSANHITSVRRLFRIQSHLTRSRDFYIMSSANSDYTAGLIGQKEERFVDCLISVMILTPSPRTVRKNAEDE